MIVQALKRFVNRFDESLLQHWLHNLIGGRVWMHVSDYTEDRIHRGLPAFRFVVHAHPVRFGLQQEVSFNFSFATYAGLWGFSPLRISRESVGTSLAAGFHFAATIMSDELMSFLGERLELPKYESLITSIRFFDKAVWWSVWNNDDQWSKETPRWKYGSWHPLDTFLGRRQFSSKLIEQADVVVPMPEKGYSGYVEIRRDVWKRPRWPFPTVISRDEGADPDPG